MKTLNTILLAFAIIISASCSKDFLDTTPLTEKTDGNYYTTPEEASEALAGCYDALQLIYSDGVSFPMASEVMSDNCFGGTGAGDADNYKMIDEYDMSVAPSDLNMYEGNWRDYYKGIFRCNTLLMNLDNVDWGNHAEQRNIIESEAKFLRAYFYFDMVRLWERVPLLTMPTVENVSQADPDETYKLIANDLLFAIENGRTQQYGQMAASSYGHATKWAAESLMARVFLFYTGYYGEADLVGLITKPQALGFVEDVIASSGHDLLDNYSDLWPAAAQYEAAQAGNSISNTSYAGETNMEIVFAIKYTYTSNYDGNTDGNHWMVMNGLRNMNWTESGYGSGWGACTVPQEFYNDWETQDTRREASIMAIEEENIDYTKADDVKEYTGYFTKKYTPLCDSAGNSTAVDLGGGNFMIGQYQDFFVMRYADVLLMAAELESPDALNYLNKVRIRAGLEVSAGVDKDIIYEERRHELAFEGIRYWDLLRYDQNLQYASEKLSYNGTVLTGGVEDTKIINSGNLSLTRGLSQIPYNQITLSGGVLKQNTGW